MSTKHCPIADRWTLLLLVQIKKAIYAPFPRKIVDFKLEEVSFLCCHESLFLSLSLFASSSTSNWLEESQFEGDVDDEMRPLERVSILEFDCEDRRKIVMTSHFIGGLNPQLGSPLSGFNKETLENVRVHSDPPKIFTSNYHNAPSSLRMNLSYSSDTTLVLELKTTQNPTLTSFYTFFAVNHWCIVTLFDGWKALPPPLETTRCKSPHINFLFPFNRSLRAIILDRALALI